VYTARVIRAATKERTTPPPPAGVRASVHYRSRRQAPAIEASTALPRRRRRACASQNSRQGVRPKSAASRRGISRCKSLNALGRQPRRRRNRVGQSFPRWYQSRTGRYTRGDPVNLGRLENVGRPNDLPIDARDAYYLSMLRAGNPRFEHAYGYVAQNPLLFGDLLGLFGPGALATAGGVCIAADGPVPIGDVVGVPLVAAAAVWGAAIVIADWWGNGDECTDCNPDPCDAQYAADSEICRRQPSARLKALCWARAADRYGDCLAGHPIRPLFPLE